MDILKVPGLEWYPALHWNKTDKFKKPPILLVMHSGDKFPGVAEYEAKTGGYKKNGKDIHTCYHLAYSASSGHIVQQVSLDMEAWHVGGSVWNKAPGIRINTISIGLALPGPWNGARNKDLLDETRNVVSQLVSIVPSLKYWVRHSDIDKSKKDPGPFFPENVFEGLLLRG